MIARVWHGWTRRQHADAYEALLRSTILPGIRRVPGNLGAHLLRRDVEGDELGDTVEFVTITWFDSLDAVRAFAGTDYTMAVIAPEAEKLLSRYDRSSVHYELVERVE